MKSSQKITRIQLLTNDPDEQSVFGIVTADPDYKLSLKLNKTFRISLKNIPPIEITDEGGKELIFSRFSDMARSPEVVFHLFSNRSGKEFLIKKLKNIDYILMLQDSGKSYDIGKLTAQLRDIDTITAVFNIELGKLKDKNQKYLI